MARLRKCKWCGTNKPADEGFQTPIMWFCDKDCAFGYAQSAQEKQRAKQLAKAKQSQRKEEKQARASLRRRREKLKTASEYMKEAQAAVNKYVRARDYGKQCISCGNQMDWHKPGGAVDAGHYRSRGSASHLRFNLKNIAAQCVRCNRHLSGNVTAFRVGLINRIGLEAVEAIEQNNKPRRFTIEYLKRIKKIFNKKARRIEGGN